MKAEIVKFYSEDEVLLNGILYKGENSTKRILIEVHGMTSNCLKKREEMIANEVQNIAIDSICFNNRGSEIAKYMRRKDGTKFIGGTAFEDVQEGYYDILGAIKFAVDLGYTSIYLQGHSLGSTKIVYTYNKMQKERNPYMKYIKGIILLSLIDIPDMMLSFTPKEYIEYANQKEKENNISILMPEGSTIHPMSVKTFLKYIKYYHEIDFARYSNEKEDFKILNNIQVPLFMRWGDTQELIKRKAKEQAEFVKTKIKNANADIGYIEGANHSYKGKEEILAKQICEFLGNIN